MPRYFLQLSYDGTHYSGWQRQSTARSVQGTIEEALSKMLREEIALAGCGRTDAGVHALRYVAHFDTEAELPEPLIYRLNRYLPPDIAIERIVPVGERQHARFDATHRAYVYHVHLGKDPFRRHFSYHFPFGDRLERRRLEEAAALLLEYEDFTSFCKLGNDAKTMLCDLRQSEWRFFPEENRMEYHIAANRFLRGMVRLIVGMCLNVGTGKIELEAVRQAMEDRKVLEQPWSVPGHGLFLRDIRYDLF